MKKYIQKLKEEKNASSNVILFSVLLSTIINIISSALFELYEIPSLVYIISGTIIIIISILGSLLYKVHKLNGTTKYKGMFIIDKESKNSMIKIPEYRINSDMCNYLKYAFYENKAMKKIWEAGSFIKNKDKKSKEDKKYNDTRKLLTELIEYSILENFSTFISDYFNSLELNSKVTELSKESVPDILFKNRFLKLFSEEMSNRSAFVEDEDKISIGILCNDEICVSYRNGAYYRKFDLQLPKGTKVYKNNNNSIIIDTKLFVLTIECLYEGFSTVVSRNFYEHYLGLSSILDYHCHQFNINVNVKYKWSSIFKINDWKYYNWLDEYMHSLEHYCDKETFLKDISWKSNEAMIRILNNMNNPSITKNSKKINIVNKKIHVIDKN